MTRVLLINAGPTLWDVEERLAGNHTLPLTDDARRSLEQLTETLPAIEAVYRCKNNEACEEVAQMIARRFKLRPRDSVQLDAWAMGLWQGLRREELKQRYPSVFQQWETAPATVVPPEGESFGDAVERIRAAVRKIIRKNRNYRVALVLRPSALHIAAGVLRGETVEQIAGHLQNPVTTENIELRDEAINAI